MDNSLPENWYQYFDYLQQKCLPDQFLLKAKKPDKAVVFLAFVHKGQMCSGTAFFITHDIVLTAAHNVYNLEDGQFYSHIRLYSEPDEFQWAYSQDAYQVDQRRGKPAIYVPWQYCDPFTEKAYEWDYAFVKVHPQFKKKHPQRTHLGIHCSNLNNQELQIIGYPGRQAVMRLDKIRATQYYKKGDKRLAQVYRQGHKNIFYRISTEKGQSGSPVYNSKGYVVAIHVGGTEGFNVGRVIDFDLWQTLKQWAYQNSRQSFVCQDLSKKKPFVPKCPQVVPTYQKYRLLLQTNQQHINSIKRLVLLNQLLKKQIKQLKKQSKHSTKEGLKVLQLQKNEIDNPIQKLRQQRQKQVIQQPQKIKESRQRASQSLFQEDESDYQRLIDKETINQGLNASQTANISDSTNDTSTPTQLEIVEQEKLQITIENNKNDSLSTIKPLELKMTPNDSSFAPSQFYSCQEQIISRIVLKPVEMIPILTHKTILQMRQFTLNCVISELHRNSSLQIGLISSDALNYDDWLEHPLTIAYRTVSCRKTAFIQSEGRCQLAGSQVLQLTKDDVFEMRVSTARGTIQFMMYKVVNFTKNRSTIQQMKWSCQLKKQHLKGKTYVFVAMERVGDCLLYEFK